MTLNVDVDVWVRGTHHATTHRISSVPAGADAWTESDVKRLLSEMLLAIEREKNPGGDPPPVTLRGFSWIVSPDHAGGVLLHLDMQMGTASAGPFRIDERRLSELVERVIEKPASADRVH
jgi:hypothetical protein